MRALLLTNPKATATSRRVREVITSALAADLKLDIVHTTHRGHAIELGTQATEDGYEYVVVVGGDGTVNEVVNGMLAGGPGAHVPTLAVVPGGSANVFARTLGLPNNPVDATGQILEALQEGRSRSIGLGHVDGRWFVFAAGFGFDAEVIHKVELRRGKGKKATPHLYARTAVRNFFRSGLRKDPPMALHIPGQDPIDGLYLAVVSNTTPWTYFNSRPVQVSPEARFETGLDVFALKRTRAPSTLRTLWQITRDDPQPHGKKVRSFHDLDAFTITSTEPTELQVDGDFAGLREIAHFTAVPHALRVIA